MALSPAKINLYLHVCGRRADGYHLLDSLLAPLAFGDAIEVFPNQDLTLEVTGSALSQEPAEQNLAMKAARALQAELGIMEGARIVLQKRIPQAAGLGGGSADAAAALNLLSALWKKNLSKDRLLKIALSLGADVPFFFSTASQYAEGIGEKITPVRLPELQVLLVNPGIPVPTAQVFAKGFASYSSPAKKYRQFEDTEALASYLRNLSNDLTPNAISIAPAIADILMQMEKQPGCLLARMSGSGGTCFGLFRDAESCKRAAEKFMPYWTQVTHSL